MEFQLTTADDGVYSPFAGALADMQREQQHRLKGLTALGGGSLVAGRRAEAASAALGHAESIESAILQRWPDPRTTTRASLLEWIKFMNPKAEMYGDIGGDADCVDDETMYYLAVHDRLSEPIVLDKQNRVLNHQNLIKATFKDTVKKIPKIGELFEQIEIAVMKVSGNEAFIAREVNGDMFDTDVNQMLRIAKGEEAVPIDAQYKKSMFYRAADKWERAKKDFDLLEGVARVGNMLQFPGKDGSLVPLVEFVKTAGLIEGAPENPGAVSVTEEVKLLREEVASLRKIVVELQASVGKL
jgi:hypothetical protein